MPYPGNFGKSEGWNKNDSLGSRGVSKFEETTLLSKENGCDVSFRPKYFAGFRLPSEKDEIAGVNLAQLLKLASPTRSTASHIIRSRPLDSR